MLLDNMGMSLSNFVLNNVNITSRLFDMLMNFDMYES